MPFTLEPGALALLALLGLNGVKARWRKTWPELAGATASALRL